MRVSDRFRVLFVHVQKTGGVTVTRIFDQHVEDSRRIRRLDRHAGLREVLRREPELATYWVFGFVRNPWARMVSWWTMIQEAKAEVPDGGDPFGRARQMARNEFWQSVATYGSFDEFIERGTQEHPRLRKPQLDYLVSRHRRADFIGRTETFWSDLTPVLDRLEITGIEPEHLNRSTHEDHRAYYTPATRRIVGQLFRKDIRTFDYEF